MRFLKGKARRLFSVAALIAVAGFGLTACEEDSNGAAPVCGDGILQANSGEECDDGPLNNDDGPCRIDCTLASNCAVNMNLACIDVQCGDFKVADSCGVLKTVSCGGCSQEGEHCYKNRCVTGCELSEDDVADICLDRCGMLQTADTCGKSTEIDCGRTCGEGNICNLAQNVCVSPSECEIEEGPYCAQSRCGAAMALDDCGETILFDCSWNEDVDVIDPLEELEPIEGSYVGPVYSWDETGTYRVGSIEQGDVSMYILFAASLKEGDLGTLGTVTTTPAGYLNSCETEFCVIVMKRTQTLDYWYDSVSGQAVVVSLDPVQIKVMDAYFSEYVDAYHGKSCLTSPVDFVYSSGVVCNSNGLDEYNQTNFGIESNGYGYETPFHYDVGTFSFDYDQVVYYHKTEELFVYIDINNFHEMNKEIPLNSPIAIDTLGGFTTDGYPYCHSQSCLMIYGEAQYNAYEGTIELTRRSQEQGLAGNVSGARFYMTEATTVTPIECQTPAIGFSFETSPGTYTNGQGQQVSYYRNYEESFSWQTACEDENGLLLPETEALSGKTYLLASAEKTGWSELEFWSDDLNSVEDFVIVNVNTYLGKVPPFDGGDLKPFEDHVLHPMSSDWEIQNNTPYCYSSVCIGYVHDQMLYSPVSGSVSIASIEEILSGSAANLVFYGSEALDDEGNPEICLYAPISFSFSGEIESIE